MTQGSVMKERGAALIVVLSLLTISLVVGLMSMQSSQIDERLAGNYRAAAEAQMGAEKAAAFGWEEVKNENKTPADIDNMQKEGNTVEFDPNEEVKVYELWSQLADSQVGKDAECESPIKCRYGYSIIKSDYYIVAIGVVVPGAESSPIAISGPVMVKLKSKPEVTIGPAITSCSGEGLEISDNVTVKKGDVIAKGDVEIEEGSIEKGNVIAIGDVEIKEGSFVSGDVIAGGKVELDDDGKVGGEVEEYSSKSDILKKAPYCKKNFKGFENSKGKKVALKDAVKDLVKDLHYSGKVESDDKKEWTLDSEGLKNSSEKVKAAAESAWWDGDNFPVVYLKEFKKEKGSLRVTGDVVLLVEEELELGDDDDFSLIVEPEASLTVIVEKDGKVEVGFGSETRTEPGLNSKGKLPFSILAVGNGGDDIEIDIGKNTELALTIFAPFREVEVDGEGGSSKLYGSIVAGKLEIEGDDDDKNGLVIESDREDSWGGGSGSPDGDRPFEGINGWQ